MAAASSHPRPRVSAMAFSPRSSEKQAVDVLVMFPCKAARKEKDEGSFPTLSDIFEVTLQGVAR